MQQVVSKYAFLYSISNVKMWGREDVKLCLSPRSTSPPHPPSPYPARSYSSYRLPPVVMSPVVSVQHSEGAPTLSQRERKEGKQG